MAHILEGLTPIRRLPKQIEAADYNRVRLAYIRNAGPLRVALTGYRGLEVIVTDAAWLCVENLGQDQPVLAWSDFGVAHRDALHTPVPCWVSLYHTHAGLVMGSALTALRGGEWHLVSPRGRV